MLAEHHKELDRVLVLEVDETALLERIHARVDQSGENIREDDSAEVLKNRLDVYRSQTAPVLPYYEEKGIITRVNGMDDIEQVSMVIENHLEQAA